MTSIIIYNLSLLVVFALFMVAAYFFAFSESSTVAAQRLLLHHAASEGDSRAKLVEAFKDNPRRFFGTTLVGTNLCIVIMSIVGAHSLLPNLGISVAVATIIVDIAILVLAEITPKTLSLSNPTVNSLKTAKLLDVISRIFIPITWLITYLPSKIFDIDKIFHAGSGELITEDQIKHMITLGAAQGSIDRDEGKRAVKVFEFGDTTVEEVMTPRADMVTVTEGTKIHDALQLINKTGFSRIPVMSKKEEDSLGFISAKDILEFYKKGRVEETVDSCLRELKLVPETKKILNLLSEFRAGGEQIAIAVNEFGTITGLVTLEDILEEILGEIYDEYDREAPSVQSVKGNLIFPGSYSVEKLAKRLKINSIEGDYDTAAGLVLHLLGHVPIAGEKVDVDGWTLVATHVFRNRITRILAIRKSDVKKSV
jgi:CBS domain containing-hemolysin-like protein